MLQAMNELVFSNLFTIGLTMCAFSGVMDLAMDKYTTHAFLEHPAHPKIGFLCQAFFLIGLLLCFFPPFDTEYSQISLETLFLRALTWLTTILILRIAVTMTMCCYQLHTRWHIFGK